MNNDYIWYDIVSFLILDFFKFFPEIMRNSLN